MPPPLKNFRPVPDALHGRIILVTGAGSGIGRAVALSLAGFGATIILLARTAKKLIKVYDQIVGNDCARPSIFPLDLETADGSDYDKLYETIKEEYGRLDGLLHNAGLAGTLTPIEHYDVGVWQQVIHVNLTAPFILCRCLLPLLKESDDASIVFTSSGVARKGRAYWGAYAVSKFGTEGLMQVLADETEENTHIRVNSINPGATRTQMRAQAYPAEDPSKLTKPEDIVGAYLYLLGPDSKGVTGRSFEAQ